MVFISVCCSYVLCQLSFVHLGEVKEYARVQYIFILGTVFSITYKSQGKFNDAKKISQETYRKLSKAEKLSQGSFV